MRLWIGIRLWIEYRYGKVRNVGGNLAISHVVPLTVAPVCRSKA